MDELTAKARKACAALAGASGNDSLLAEFDSNPAVRQQWRLTIAAVE